MVGITNRNDTYPARGERIAAWVERYMARTGLSVGELAFRVKADKRDIRRLLNDRSCGPRLNDALEEAFQWDFVEQVATPVIGADPLTAREKAVEQRLTEAAALHARVERERTVRAAAETHLVGVARASTSRGPSKGGASRSFDPPAPQGA